MCHSVGMNIKVLSLSAAVAFSGLIACAADKENVGSGEQNATTDIDHMFKRPDGKFDVWCTNGTFESGRTAEEINQNLACGGAGSGSSSSSSGTVTPPPPPPPPPPPASCLNTNPIDQTQIPYVKAAPRQPGACTAQDVTTIGTYYKTNGPTPTFTTTAWASSVSAACSACVFTPNETAAPAQAWGPIVTKGDKIDAINRGGCIELVSGSEACGRAYQQFQGCLVQACRNAECSDAQKVAACRQDQRVYSTSCKGAVEALIGACGSVEALQAHEQACKNTQYTWDGPIKQACIDAPPAPPAPPAVP